MNCLQTMIAKNSLRMVLRIKKLEIKKAINLITEYNNYILHKTDNITFACCLICQDNELESSMLCDNCYTNELYSDNRNFGYISPINWNYFKDVFETYKGVFDIVDTFGAIKIKNLSLPDLLNTLKIIIVIQEKIQEIIRYLADRFRMLKYYLEND